MYQWGTRTTKGLYSARDYCTTAFSKIQELLQPLTTLTSSALTEQGQVRVNSLEASQVIPSVSFMYAIYLITYNFMNYDMYAYRCIQLYICIIVYDVWYDVLFFKKKIWCVIFDQFEASAAFVNLCSQLELVAVAPPGKVRSGSIRKGTKLEGETNPFRGHGLSAMSSADLSSMVITLYHKRSFFFAVGTNM